MAYAETAILIDLVREAAHPLIGDKKDYDPLMAMIGDAPLVLLGEGSHGTHEFYRERAQITKRLINEKGFTAVAVEADWPDAYRVNRYVRDVGTDVDSIDALDGFKRFPAWMWRNAVKRPGCSRMLNSAVAVCSSSSPFPGKQPAGGRGCDLNALLCT